MNDSAGSVQSREHKTWQPAPATALVSHRVLPEKVAEYRQAQTAITDAARKFPGFVGTEVLSPVPGLQDERVAIFRLESNQAMKHWLESPERATLAEHIEHYLAEPSYLLILASDDRTEPPVAIVLTHRVRKEWVADYLAWRRRAIAAQAHFHGYLATEFFEPNATGQEEWVDIVRYDSADHLNAWLESKERKDLLKELDPIVVNRHAHRITGLEGWFALNRAPEETAIRPPPWKQALTVLLALYPTVMTLTLLTGPLMRNLSLPVKMLIGNTLSVALLTWVMMPWVTRWLNFWLSIPPHGDMWWKEALGICTVAGFLALFVVVFGLV